MPRLRLVLLPLVIVAGGGALAGTLIANGPKVESVQTEVPTTFVEVEVARPRVHHVRIEAMGVVKLEKAVVMQPEVAGRIIEQNTQLVPGGRVAEGDPLVRIDPRDYSAAVAAMQADLAQAKLLVQEERTLKAVAEHEWRTRPEGLSEETLKFALRDPHLDAARARVSSAQSRIAKAKRDLSRTVVRAPFDAVVVEESVDVGQTVAPGVPNRDAGRDRPLLGGGVDPGRTAPPFEDPRGQHRG